MVKLTFHAKTKINVDSFSDGDRYGVVLCQSNSTLFSPVALYSEEKGLCAFNNNILPLYSLNTVHVAIQKIIGRLYREKNGKNA